LPQGKSLGASAVGFQAMALYRANAMSNEGTALDRYWTLAILSKTCPNRLGLKPPMSEQRWLRQCPPWVAADIPG